MYYVACHVHPLPGDVMLTSLKSCRSPCTWHCHHAAERATKFYPCRDVAIQFARFESGGLQHLHGVSFKRWSTVRRSMMWRSWKNVCWASGGCWTTPSSQQKRLRSGVVVWMHDIACTKNYENMSIFVKLRRKSQWQLFYLDTVYLLT